MSNALECRWARWTTGLCLALGCTASPPGSERASPDGAEGAKIGELGAAERARVLAFLGARGVSSAAVTFVGRRVMLQGDAFLYADDVLRRADGALVDKGRVPTLQGLSSSGFPDCAVETCAGVAPVRYAALDAGNPDEMLFRRPDTTHTYFLVVEDDVPEYFTSSPFDAGTAGGILGAAVAAIVDAAPADCLEPGLFQVIRNREYGALPLETRERSYATRVSSGGFFEVCSGSAVACANLPRLARVVVSSGDASTDAADAGAAAAPDASGLPLTAGARERLRFGDHIAFVDTGLVQPTTALVELSAYTIGVATHELLHTLGLGHTTAGLLAESVVPGTAAGQDHLSILHASIYSPNYRSTLQEDDRLLLQRLYGESCEYSAEFRRIAP